MSERKPMGDIFVNNLSEHKLLIKICRSNYGHTLNFIICDSDEDSMDFIIEPKSNESMGLPE